eukprot:TRINITY_DN17317_c0_g1_i1.p1 TRINITY_DN17317_c0_g1~~TRINITY_DN17317_c0_g1_i1.p1  ORF type:complete len:605 (+),score=78.30 TRINITY_DN17317_c0_g1_i1:273-1817(+)
MQQPLPKTPPTQAPNVTVSKAAETSSAYAQEANDDDADDDGRVFSVRPVEPRDRGTVVKPQVTISAKKVNCESIQQELRYKATGHSTFMDKVKSRLSLGSSTSNGRVYQIVQSPIFESLVCVFIVVNALLIGAEQDWMLKNPGAGENQIYHGLNICFATVFFLELVLRIIADGLRFYSYQNDAFYWNVFDTLLVLSSLTEEALSQISVNIDISAMRFFRILRVIRSLRIVRMFRMFRDLRVIVAGIAHSLRSLVWALLLLFCIMYLVAVCLLQFAGEEMALQLSDPSSSSLQQAEYKKMVDFYGSLFQAVYTLYLAICGGIDWRDAATPMFALSTPLGIIFCLYVGFATFCVLNIVTGVFVESANKLCCQDAEMVLMEEMDKRRNWFSEVKSLFEHADRDHTGYITLEEFRVRFKDAAMMAWLRKVGIEVESHTTESLFDLLDLDGDGLLDLDEFCIALESVHGVAKAIDLARVRNDTRTLRKLIGSVTRELQQQQLRTVSAASVDSPPTHHLS